MTGVPDAAGEAEDVEGAGTVLVPPVLVPPVLVPPALEPPHAARTPPIRSRPAPPCPERCMLQEI